MVRLVRTRAQVHCAQLELPRQQTICGKCSRTPAHVEPQHNKKKPCRHPTVHATPPPSTLSPTSLMRAWMSPSAPASADGTGLKSSCVSEAATDDRRGAPAPTSRRSAGVCRRDATDGRAAAAGTGPPVGAVVSRRAAAARGAAPVRDSRAAAAAAERPPAYMMFMVQSRGRDDGGVRAACVAGESARAVRGGVAFVVEASVYCASHKNWIRNIRFSIINRPLSQ